MAADFADKRVDLAREPDFPLGGMQVRPATRQVEFGGASETLEPRVMQVLVVLGRNAGEVVSRDDLIQTCWEGRVVGEDALNRCISKVRKLQEASGAFQLETIPRVGYRLTSNETAAAPADQPVAQVTAPRAPDSLGAPDATPAEQPVVPAGPAPRRWDMRVVAGLAAASLVILVAVFFALQPRPGPSQSAAANQLIAFFGFSPASDDPVLKSTAEAASDAMFQAIRSNWVGTAPRTETRGIAEDLRFKRATELGARYAMGGDVRSDANGTTISVRFEDVPYRLTLWEKSITSPAPDVAYIPAQAASQVSFVVWCIVKTREGLTHDTPELLGLVADRCREGGGVSRSDASYIVSRMRALIEADPGSAYNQAQLVNVLGLGLPFAPAPARAAWIAEAEAALQRAIELDPNETNILFARICLGFGKNIPAAEWDALLLDAQAKADAKDNFASAQANAYRAALLSSAGRFADALPHAVASNANKASSTPGSLGLAQAPLGRVAEARADLEPVLAAYGSQVWDTFIPYAFFLNAPDADAMLASPPSTIPKPTLDCLRDIRRALVSNDQRIRSAEAKKVRECGEAGVVSRRVALPALAALGDLDGAFAEAGRLSFSIPAVRSYETATLFYPATRAMRADPRFLPMVEKMGMMDYWRASRSEPDVCATENAPFCAALKTANATP